MIRSAPCSGLEGHLQCLCVQCGIWLYVMITKGYWVREMVLGLLLGLMFCWS